MILARLTSAKAANMCTRYISNSSQMPWYTKGAGCRHLRMSQHVLERPCDILLHPEQRFPAFLNHVVETMHQGLGAKRSQQGQIATTQARRWLW